MKTVGISDSVNVLLIKVFEMFCFLRYKLAVEVLFVQMLHNMW